MTSDSLKYSGKENPTLEPTIDEHVQQLIDLVRKYAISRTSGAPSKRMDLSRKIPYFTLDVISHLSLGQAFGNLLADKDQNDYLKALEAGLKISNTVFAFGLEWLRSTPIIGPAISPSENDPSGFGRMIAEARKLIAARVSKATEGKSDMLASFIRHGVEGDDLFQETFEQILAGSDTTAAAIRIIMLYIISHPRVYNKLQDEIDAAVKLGSVSPSGVISDASARQLPYLCAVIREGMRVSHAQSPYQCCLLISCIPGPPTRHKHLLPHHPFSRRDRHYRGQDILHPRRRIDRLFRMVHAPQQPRPLWCRRIYIPS